MGSMSAVCSSAMSAGVSQVASQCLGLWIWADADAAELGFQFDPFSQEFFVNVSSSKVM